MPSEFLYAADFPGREHGLRVHIQRCDPDTQKQAAVVSVVPVHTECPKCSKTAADFPGGALNALTLLNCTNQTLTHSFHRALAIQLNCAHSVSLTQIIIALSVCVLAALSLSLCRCCACLISQVKSTVSSSPDCGMTLLSLPPLVVTHSETQW